MQKSFKLLCVGNSFSDNMLSYSYTILKSFGVKNIVLANLYIGGCDLLTHKNNIENNLPNYIYRKNTTGIFKSTENYTVDLALQDEKWDYVTMQQASGKSGLIDTYNDNIKYIKDYIHLKIKNSALKVGWNMTWAYANSSKHPEFKFYNNDQICMFNSILNCVNSKIINNDFDFIVPAGTAIQNARTSYLKDSFTADDGYHLEDLGEFITGLVLILKITNFDIEDLDLNLIPQKFIPFFDIIKESVINALNNPFKITKSIFSKSSKVIENDNDSCIIMKDIPYSKDNDYSTLNMYLPKSNKFDAIIHIHGGGLESGSKDDYPLEKIAKDVVNNNIGFVSINYSLYPNASFPEYINDAAKAIKYVYSYLITNNILKRIFISGQSAGAYIGMMLCFNTVFLQNVGINPLDISGWILESGQPSTHFNILKYTGLDSNRQIIDDKAPLFYINQNTKFSNLLLIAYTNDIPCRKEQLELTYKAILNYNPNAKVNYRLYEGNHCCNSTLVYRNNCPYSKILIDYITNI